MGRLSHLACTAAVAALAAAGAGPAHAAGDVAKGRKVAIEQCSRCHVVGDYNPLGGIDSTPSFPLLARRADLAERVRSFYVRRPHPAFVSGPGAPRRSKLPAYAVPFTVTEADIENLLAYIRTLKGWRPPFGRRRR